MAKSIFKGVGKVLGIGGKKKPAEAPAPAAEQKGPVVAQLSGDLERDARRRRGERSRGRERPLSTRPTILSDKLGS